MHRYTGTFITVLMGGLLPAVAMSEKASLQSSSLARLERRLEEIDSGLAELAHFSLRHGMGTIGYRSDARTTPAHTEWVQVDLGQNTPIDLMALVPVIWHDAQTGYRADSFPEAFRIIAGASGDTNGTRNIRASLPTSFSPPRAWTKAATKEP